MVMSTSKTLQPLDPQCNHDGGTRYWCRECAFEAAIKLKAENERLRAEVNALRDFTARRPRLKK